MLKAMLVLLAILAAVIVLVAVRWHRRTTAPRDVNLAMRSLADEAVAWAARDGVTLDFSADSVERVDALLASRHALRAAGEFPDAELHRAAARFGAYIGEVIRRTRGEGEWTVDDEVGGPGSFPLHWGGGTSFPVAWCGKRVLNGEEDNVWIKFRMNVLQDAGRLALTDDADASTQPTD